MIDDSLRARWMEEKFKRWSPPDWSHEAYLAWWRENGGEDTSGSYTMAEHIEIRLRLIAKSPLPRVRDLFHFYDRLRKLFGPLIAAEALRPTLTTMATAQDGEK